MTVKIAQTDYIYIVSYVMMETITDSENSSGKSKAVLVWDKGRDAPS